MIQQSGRFITAKDLDTDHQTCIRPLTCSCIHSCSCPVVNSFKPAFKQVGARVLAYLEVGLAPDPVAGSSRTAPVLRVTCAHVSWSICHIRSTSIALLPSCGHCFTISIHMLHQRLCTAAGVCHYAGAHRCQPEWLSASLNTLTKQQ